MAFSIKNWFKGKYRLGGSAISVMEVPPGWSYEAYLKVYGEVGWLFAANNIISESVAEVQWNLYNKDGRQKGDLVESHPVLDLFAYVNPFQTKYQFLQLLQLYIGLVGENRTIGRCFPRSQWLNCSNWHPKGKTNAP